RFISNHKIDFNGFELNHHGYNEFFDFKESSYFGRHRFHTPLLKIKDNKIFWDIKLHAEADLYFDEHGIFDERYGLRVYGPASQLGNLFNGGYGYSEITGNSDIIRFTNYSGIKIDDKFGLEFFNAIDYKKNGSVGEYYDVLLSNNVGNNTDVFINGIRNSKNKTIFGGFRINF
ncbi:hypothetical protein HN836_00675, partial [Candidatus Woesearchaeota archaeon]|nr:hypothetical protein [Candidatus Woesearchaeota archaeon]